MRHAPLTLSPCGRGWRGLSKAKFEPGERLSGLSSCIGEGGTRVACFCVEANEKLAGQRDADDHFFLSGGDQSVAEAAEAFVVAGGDGCDQEHDGTDAGPTTR